jgi:hypothetical protein
VWLLTTPVGQQALVDERVRVVETLGGQIDDVRYAALKASPPVETYFASGGRPWLLPPVTLLVAWGLVLLARADGAPMSFATGLAVTVHASVVLALAQVMAIPLNVVRESITSPTTLAALVPMVEDGTVAAGVLGAIDTVGLWWLWLLALGVAAATNRPAARYFWRLLAAYAGVAVLMAATVAVMGGL